MRFSLFINKIEGLQWLINKIIATCKNATFVFQYTVDFLNAIYFRRGLTCTLGLTNNLIDGGQPRDKNGF